DFPYMSFASNMGSTMQEDSIIIHSITINKRTFPKFRLLNKTIEYYCNSEDALTISLEKTFGETNPSLQFKWKFPTDSNSHWTYLGEPVPPEITTYSPQIT